MTDGNVYNANGLKIEDNARTSVAAVGSSASNTVYGGALGFSNVIGVTTNSSLSGLVAENNIKEATNLKYFVVVADGSINQSMMDWAAWASSLAGKANVGLDNVSAAGKNTAFEWGVPDYTSGVSKSTSGFTATQNGFVQALLSAYGAGNYAEILINGVIAYRANSSIITDFAPIVSGDIITVNTGGTGQVNAMTFFPIRGAS